MELQCPQLVYIAYNRCGENKGFPTLGHMPFTGHWVQRGLASLLHAIDIRPTDARQFPPS